MNDKHFTDHTDRNSFGYVSTVFVLENLLVYMIRLNKLLMEIIFWIRCSNNENIAELFL